MADTPVVVPVVPVADPFEAQIRSVSQMGSGRGIMLLLYGPSGAGKTSLLATLPPARTLVYDVDGGMSVLRSIGWDGRIVEAPKDLANLREFMAYVGTAKHQYSTVAIDTASFLERRMVFAFADQRKKELVDIKEYGDAAVKLRSYLVQLRDLTSRGINVVLIAHETSDIKGREGVLFPFLSAKLAIEVIGWCDLVGRLAVEPNGARTLAFGADPRTVTKSRYRCVQPVEGMDLVDLFTRIYGEQGREIKKSK